MVKLSKRLNSLVKYVYEGDIIMDVGCDHALLDIYLLQNGILNSAYVCDVNANALQNGINNIKANGLEKKIIPILGYGIERIGELPVNTLIISGMGTKTIINILESPNINRVYKLILQSNNNYYDLRKFIMDSGFTIINEEVVEDGKKTYLNIVAGRDRVPARYTKEELEFGPILMKDPQYLDYFKKLRDEYEDLYFKNKNPMTKESVGIIENIIKDLSNS